MRRIIACLITSILITTFTATSFNAETTSQSETVGTPSASEDAFEKMEALGNVEVENGILTVKITLPAEYVGPDVTQEKLDEEAGEDYQSAILNSDGTVTYKMTKKQHQDMLSSLKENIDSSIKKMVDDNENYAIESIDYNDTFTEFNLHMESNTVGLGDSYAVITFYMAGGIYGIFSGEQPDNIVVNYYDPDGNLIQSGNSNDTAKAVASY